METAELVHEVQIDAPIQEVYTAFLNSEGHSAMTNSKAEIMAREGASFRAGDGYIHGKNLVLVPLRKIKQIWVADEEGWPEGHQSQVIFDFKEYDGGTRIEFRHLNVPKKVAPKINEGWVNHYWQPMKEYFGNLEY